MPTLNLKPTHKAVKDYYASLSKFDQLNVAHETAVRSPFQSLLDSCGRKLNLTLVPEYSISLPQNRHIVVDGALVHQYKLVHGYWEAKDIHDDLEIEVKKKLDRGYPSDNILFQTPERAILWQNGSQVLDVDLTDRSKLIKALQSFFAHRPAGIVRWEEAVAEFKDKVPDIGSGLSKLIHEQRRSNRLFEVCFKEFLEKCRLSINPNLSEAAVEEMLIQHLLTERIFRTVFSNPDFTNRNAIAREIETVITALTSRAFSRDEFLQGLDRFYIAIERTAETINDFSQKQHFLNTVYEQFFQGFSVKVADTHGVVYTPQPVVDFMVKSVENILQTEFSRSISDAGVHIIDPFVGTGNFIVRIMREISKTGLEEKFANDLHCNEVMLLPYYIASMNIEHEFYKAVGHYRPFEGLCLVDTFELAEEQQLPLFTAENTARIEQQKKTPISVVIGNPPYNAGQVNDSDNNRNRIYVTMDKRIRDTYSKDSNATLRNQLYDPYVKAIRWASDRIGNEGIVAFITNNGFFDGIAFDGMRKHLLQDFSEIYHINLKGDARTSGERRRKEGGNIFHDLIRVGIGISFLIKKPRRNAAEAQVWTHSVDDFLKDREKQDILTQFGDYSEVPFRRATIDTHHGWLVGEQHADFSTFVPIGTKVAKSTKGPAADVIFKVYSSGVKTNRDAWAFNFDRTELMANMNRLISTYNGEVDRWIRREHSKAVPSEFVNYDERKIKWDRELRQHLVRGTIAEYADGKIRGAHYRPFTRTNLYFDRVTNNCVYVFPAIFPSPETELENLAICLTAVGNKKQFHCIMTKQIPDLHLTGDSQCFSYYIYDEDATNRRENITDWALERFRKHYRDCKISKRSIFHYVYGVLHHPDYRERYQENLKRELPHIPYTPSFWPFANAGARLAEIHVGYEQQPEYSLNHIENPDKALDWRVEKMKLSKDGKQIQYNDFLTLDGIPPKTFDYQLGNRSALEWVIDQYRVKTDNRSGIKNDPNRADDEQYIVRLIGKIITVSLETAEIVDDLPEMGS